MNAPIHRWTDRERAKKREQYARHFSSSHGGRAQGITVPDDITVLTRDPSPCFQCEARGPCRHRKWQSDPAGLRA